MTHPYSAPRLVNSFVQDIRAPIEEVFPLLCPEREKEWLPGWDARMIHSASGVAERGAVFETRQDAGRTLWIVTEYDPPRRIAFARWQPDGLAVHIEITLARQHAGSTAVCISYASTAVDETGAAALAGLGEDAWLGKMAFWQESMNAWFDKQSRSGRPPR
jgi:uncharacterized protein YndB with AHSA1/START domain